MKRKKTIVTLFLAIVMLLSLCACGEKKEPEVEATPTPEVTPTPTPIPDSEIYVARVNNTICRSSPEVSEANYAGIINAGTQVRYVEERNNYIKVSLPTGVDVWVFTWYLECQDPIVNRIRQVNYMSELLKRDTFEDIEGDPIYTCMTGVLNCRVEPTTNSPVLNQLQFGDEVNVIGKDGEFYLCMMEDGSAVYCHQDYLTEQATYIDMEGTKDLSVYMYTADFDLRFASENNVTGTALYPASPLLEDSTAEKLHTAFEHFRKDGYTMKIYDAYRPLSAQDKIFAAVGDERLVKNPATGPCLHQFGRAVDISLVNMYNGKELRMPTAMYDFSEAALRENSDSWAWDLKQNVDYMTRVMTEAGFTATGCWWHFENPGVGGMPTELDYAAQNRGSVSEYIKQQQAPTATPVPQETSPAPEEAK